MNLRPIYELLYLRPCRAYARHFVEDRPADFIYRCLCSLIFYKEHFYWPHFKNPRSFSEKVWNRMLFVRDHRLTMLSDKLRVRDYVARIVGSEYLIPLLWNGEKAEEISYENLPLKFVIKVTHGCKYNIIVRDKTQLDQTNTRLQLKQWLSENYCYESFLGVEWAYKNINPSIIVETFLECNGRVPEDYKFFCFSGRVELIQVSFDRFGDASEKLFDRDFNPLDLWNGLKLYQGKVERPDNFEEMVRVAESLARELDFIRVDLYNVSRQIYVGELTCYPASGMARFVPREYEFLLGEKWKMK